MLLLGGWFHHGLRGLPDTPVQRPDPGLARLSKRQAAIRPLGFPLAGMQTKPNAVGRARR